jgi:hypothetical protein
MNAIKSVANENIKNIHKWQQLHPNCGDSRSSKNDDYLHIVSNSMSGTNEMETDKNVARIISNIAKETVIAK